MGRKKKKLKDKDKQENNANKWVREGSKVIVIAGNEKGRTGIVLSRSKMRAKVEGLNIRKKHIKRVSSDQPGRILEIEMPIHLSNLQLATDDDQPVKVRVSISENGQRDLVYRQGDQQTVYRTINH